jgi:hypothetical protein
MKIASEKTFEEFDRLKDQLFAHKKRAAPKPKPVPNPIGRKFRWLMPVFLLGGGLYLAYRSTKSLKDYLLEKETITYQERLAWSALEMYMHCKWQELMNNGSLIKNKQLANRCYITKLESDLLYLTERAPEKKLFIETKSKVSFWVLGWRNEERIKFINQYGDLVERQRRSKLMLGDLLRIWTKTTDTLLKREKIFSFYEKELDSIGNQCEHVNYFTKLSHKSE